MMVELGLRGRIELEKTGMRRRGLLSRKVVCKNPSQTGDVLLDEALKHIKETNPPDTIQSWVELLSGENIIWLFVLCGVCVGWGGGMLSTSTGFTDMKVCLSRH